MSFAPRNKSEEETFAAEGLRVHVQHRLHLLMKHKGVSQKDLAQLMHVSEARISQLLSDEANLTVRNLGRIFHALGDECRVTSRVLAQIDAAAPRPKWKIATSGPTKAEGESDAQEDAA